VFDSDRMLALIKKEILNAAKQGTACWWGAGRPARWRGSRVLSRICVRHGSAKRSVVQAFPKQAQQRSVAAAL